MLIERLLLYSSQGHFDFCAVVVELGSGMPPSFCE